MLYILRHAQPEAGDWPNRERPLSGNGRLQAAALVQYLRELRCTAVYCSPFARAVATVRPYCAAEGCLLHELERLAESGADETLLQVRDRMVEVVSEIAGSHPGQAVLVCTHGGNIWGLLTAVDASFGYEQYRRLDAPDIRLLRWHGGIGTLDTEFVFDGLHGT